MKTAKRLFCLLMSVVLITLSGFKTDIKAKAAESSALDGLVGGVAEILNPREGQTAEDVINAIIKKLHIELVKEEPYTSTLVMANVSKELNVRSEPDADSEKVGKLYKDCGGTILERGEEWTKLQSGKVIGWCSNEYLLFDEEADQMAADVGQTIATINTETLRVRKEPDIESGVWGLVPLGEVFEVVDDSNLEEGWVCIDYEGADGFISSEFVDIDFKIDTGETMEEIKAREEAEKKAKLEAERHKNYGAILTDADTTLLLAALVQCEAGSEIYEGKLAVAAVVMNRVRSSAYPNSIHGVIYASGQFTPALNGKVNNVYTSGKINSDCIRAAEEAIAGTSNVGSATHFRRNNGRDGIVIGNHVFY